MPTTYRIFALVDSLERRRLLSGSAAVFSPRAALAVANDTISSENFDFVVTYNAASPVDLSTVGDSNIQVTGPGGFAQDASLVQTNPHAGSINPPVLATYQIIAPGNSEFTSADNGTYTISLLPDQVSLTGGTYFVAGALGSFSMNIPAGSNNVAFVPTATISVSDVTSNAATELIQVTYESQNGINAATLSNSNLTVTGPNGFFASARLLSAVNDEFEVIASYQITAPTGQFSATSSGTYTVTMNPDQVFDSSGIPVPPGPLDTFTVTATGERNGGTSIGSITQSGSTLIVTGTSSADTITVSVADSTFLQVDLDSQIEDFELSQISQTDISGLGGRDHIILRPGTPPALAKGGPGDDTISAHNGTAGQPGNTLIGGRGDDSLHAGFGDDALYGGAGDDTLLGNGQDTLVGGSGNDKISVGDDLLEFASGDTLFDSNSSRP